MLKKYLACICILSFNAVFAYTELEIPVSKSNSSIIINQTNSEYPSGFTMSSSYNKKYGEQDTAIQTIIDYLWPKKEKNIEVYTYNKKSIFTPENYIILMPNSMILSQDPNLSGFCFIWKKKEYKIASDLEKKIADYYNAEPKSSIEFLYSYKFYNSSPWAIKVGNQLHATLWVEGKKNKSDGIGSHRSSTLQNSLQDSFLVLDPKDENAITHLLLDENSRVIAKRIDETVTFRKK